MNASGTKLHRVVQATMADECIFTPSRIIIGHSETCKHPLERHGYYYYQPTLSQPANCSVPVAVEYNTNNKLSRLTFWSIRELQVFAVIDPFIYGSERILGMESPTWKCLLCYYIPCT